MKPALEELAKRRSGQRADMVAGMAASALDCTPDPNAREDSKAALLCK